MIARHSLVRVAFLAVGAGLILILSAVALRLTGPGYIRDEQMQLPQIMSGVWVTGFEESSFFPGDDVIPDRNDARRFRLTLTASRDQHDRLRDQNPAPGYLAYRVTFLGRRTKYPVGIDCRGARHYFYVPDLILRTQYLGPIANPDLPVRKPGPYIPFKRSGEGGKIRQMEDEILAHCGG